jgi:RNA polymerase sigma-70 factor (ECF subfamily)
VRKELGTLPGEAGSNFLKEQSAPEALTDQDLVRKAKEGDRGAFDRLMERHQGKIITVAYRMLGNYEDAIEVAQEAFLRMYRGLPRFREEAAFRTWAYQITLNLARHRRRWYARHRIAQTVSLDAPVSNDGDDPVYERIQDPASSPREEVGRAELREAVSRAVARLPLPWRTVVVLRDIQGLPYEEIAGICRERVGTVKSRLHRARQMLRDLLRGVTA